VSELSGPKVGVAVAITRNSRLLMGRRIGSHGNGTWSFPGGHINPGETSAGCAVREVEEETGLQIYHIKPVTFTEDFFLEDGLHYITIFVKARTDGIPQLLEPKKCTEWRWIIPYDPPSPLFTPIENLRRELSLVTLLCK